MQIVDAYEIRKTVMSKSHLRVVEGNDVDKHKALEAALGQIERAFGKGSIMRLGENSVVEAEAISTGSLGLQIEP